MPQTTKGGDYIQLEVKAKVESTSPIQSPQPESSWEERLSAVVNTHISLEDIDTEYISGDDFEHLKKDLRAFISAELQKERKAGYEEGHKIGLDLGHSCSALDIDDYWEAINPKLEKALDKRLAREREKVVDEAISILESMKRTLNQRKE